MTIDELRAKIAGSPADHDSATTEPVEFLQARCDAVLGWLHYPVGGISSGLQPGVERLRWFRGPRPGGSGNSTSVG